MFRLCRLFTAEKRIFILHIQNPGCLLIEASLSSTRRQAIIWTDAGI